MKERNDGSQVAAKVNAGGNFVFSSLTEEEAAARRTAAEGGTKRPVPPEGGVKSVAKRPKLMSGKNLIRGGSLDTSIFKHL